MESRGEKRKIKEREEEKLNEMKNASCFIYLSQYFHVGRAGQA